MKLIIDIPEWQYKSICEGIEASERCGVVGIDPTIHKAIKNGIPIVGHGRLIDEKVACNIIAEGKEGDKAYFGTLSKDWEVIDFLKTVPTVIESDMRGEEK